MTPSSIQLLNNKSHGLSPTSGHHSILFDQGFQMISGWNWSELHLTVIWTPSHGIVPGYVVYLVNHSAVKWRIWFGNSKIGKFKIFNFILLSVVVYIIYFDNWMQKNNLFPLWDQFWWASSDHILMILAIFTVSM